MFFFVQNMRATDQLIQSIANLCTRLLKYNCVSQFQNLPSFYVCVCVANLYSQSQLTLIESAN